MVKYCEACRNLHDENDLCPKYKEQLKQHPEWFDEMVQTMATASIVSPTVQRYGAAIKEHLVAYDGIDNERGTVLSKSLKDISQSRIDPNDAARNLKQQAGFSAEVKSTARANADRIIRGDDGARTIRTDDMDKQSDGMGRSIGGTNDQLYDIAEVDKNGVYIEGSGRQLKFVGNDAKSCTEKLLQSDYDKYRDSGTPLDVPSDFYNGVIKELDNKAAKLKSQIANAEAKGNTDLASKHKKQLDRVESTKDSLRKSNVSSKEAMEARTNPKWSTAKDIAKLANDAGLEAAKTGTFVGGSISILRNVVMLKNGDIKAEVAIKNIAKDTASSATSAYIVGAGGAALKGAMQNSSSAAVRAASETNIPAGAIAIAYGITKSGITNFIKYKNGEISKKEAMKYFGKDTVRTSLITCSLSMIAFPSGLAGIGLTMGVAIYLDAVCTSILDEVFGEGLYEQLLHSSGHILSTAQNSVELLQQLKSNTQMNEQYNRASSRTLAAINSKEKTVSDKLSKLADSMEGL